MRVGGERFWLLELFRLGLSHLESLTLPTVLFWFPPDVNRSEDQPAKLSGLGVLGAGTVLGGLT
jgi:hypothetical protein